MQWSKHLRLYEHSSYFTVRDTDRRLQAPTQDLQDCCVNLTRTNVFELLNSQCATTKPLALMALVTTTAVLALHLDLMALLIVLLYYLQPFLFCLNAHTKRERNADSDTGRMQCNTSDHCGS